MLKSGLGLGLVTYSGQDEFRVILKVRVKLGLGLGL